MGLLSSRRITRAVDVAYDALDNEQERPFAIIDELDDDERLPALLALAERLVDEEAYDHARLAVEQALALAPDSWEALGMLVQAERHDPERRPQAVAALRRLLAADPGNPEVAADLAMLLTETEQAEEALKLLRGLEDQQNPVVMLRTGEALVALGRQEEALTALGELRDLYNYRLKHGMIQGDQYEMREHMLEAARLFQEVQEELHGRQAVVSEEGGPGHHAADEEIDFVHLGNALMADSPRVARELQLRSTDQTLEEAERRLEQDDKDAGALALLGSVLLRRGDLDAARFRFETCVAVNRKWFAGYLGLGAVADCARFDLLAAAESLPAPPRKAAAPAVAPDWGALTDLERRVVWASVQPLRSLVPALARAGAAVRVLPIDVRAVDLDAGATPPTVRVERLLDVEGPDGWTFARELARAAHPLLPEATRTRVAALHERALARAKAAEGAAPPPAGVADFLAGAYADFLRQRHGLSEYRDPEDDGVYHDLMSLFADLAERETLGA